MHPHYPKNGRVILHVDMNSFYASVEAAYNPELKGKPLAIAGNPDERRGIIVTCSYEARKFGVKTTMTLWEAKKLCPQMIIMRPNFDRYRAASQGMFEILRQYSELVEPVSIDEGYVDITDSHTLGSPLFIAESIQNQIMSQLDLPSSIGIAPNKFLAKTASDMKKPMGITVLRKRDLPDKIWPLDVKEMHGIGEKTAQKLYTLKINTIGELAKADEIQLKAQLGINGLRLKARANGRDDRPVDPDSVYDFKSVGNSTTLPRDTANQKELLNTLNQLSKKVASRMKSKETLASTVMITMRFKNRKTITRSKKMKNPVGSQEEIFTAAKTLFLQHWNGNSIRLLGVTGQDLVERNDAALQLDIFSFEEHAKKEPLYLALEKLQTKYGKDMIKRGISAKQEKRDPHNDTSFNKDFLRRDK
ncbi:DNA polymerase IV [Bacillus sp. P14.5]|uniref:DNA polymerase IV n=1 Tax=Bacillus sp. P14.5 TaxID=1983400 RepID=UPI000DE9C5C4|nr:DNA polymerase IV [Bacillus sp. P14.5]